MPYLPDAERKLSPPMTGSGFPNIYHRWFEVISADTPALREKAYRLRYQVYCCENQYKLTEAYPSQLEMDEFDSRSVHSLVVDRTSGAAMGTVRLILSDGEMSKPEMPIQQLCRHPLPTKPHSSQTAEISRFAISKSMRGLTSNDCPKEIKCSLILGLMRAVVQMSLEYGITDWLAVMEPALLRLLCRFGICFTPIGPLVQYYGLRQPCHANVPALLDTVHRENADLWEFVTKPADCSAYSKKAASY